MQTGLNIYLSQKHTHMGSYLGNQGWEQDDTADLTILRFLAKGTPNSRPKREGTAQQYHDTDLARYDTDLNDARYWSQQQAILKLKKRGFRIKPYNDNMTIKMWPLLKKKDLLKLSLRPEVKPLFATDIK